jgi:hypothetical protein
MNPRIPMLELARAVVSQALASHCRRIATLTLGTLVRAVRLALICGCCGFTRAGLARDRRRLFSGAIAHPATILDINASTPRSDIALIISLALPHRFRPI